LDKQYYTKDKNLNSSSLECALSRESVGKVSGKMV
jgi:hypothetical protein